MRQLIVAAILALSCSSVASAQNTGKITGTFQLFPSSCKQPKNPQLYGVVAIPGTSYAAHFKSNGTFTIYNVAPGRYNLALWSLNGASFSPFNTAIAGASSTVGPRFTVKSNRTTALGTITATGFNTCCGNGQIEGSEVCDSQSLNGQTCESRGLPAGTLRCSGCEFDTSGCGSST